MGLQPPTVEARGPEIRDDLWNAVGRLIDRMDVDTIVFQRVGPLAAERWSAQGRDLPPVLVQEYRLAQLLPLLAVGVLERARAAYPGRMLLVKGPEIADLYPSGGRLYSDIDLLVDDAQAAFEALLAAGFEPADGYDDRAHHLAPVRWPGIDIPVEIHWQLGWPRHFKAPPSDELFEEAIPSRLPVDGLETAGHAHHAVLTAAHGWKHMPLRAVSELIDVTILAQRCDRAELERTARRWQVDRIWRTSEATASWLFDDGPRPLATRLWAQSLRRPRQPTLLERHVRQLAAPFWALPPRRAVLAAGRNVGLALRPGDGEGWSTKLRRSAWVATHPTRTRSSASRRHEDDGP